MLFERRCYTLQPGALAEFWQAQVDRGAEPVKPILDRLVGYFSPVGGSSDQVVHLYRYDDYEDWTSRLHGLYRVAGLEPYFRRVRVLMLAQENAFHAAAPLPECSPVWGHGRDWKPGSESPLPLALRGAEALLEERSTWLRPGTLPLFWEARAALARDAGMLAHAGADPGEAFHLGTFVSVVGRQHQVLDYGIHASFEAGMDRQTRLAHDARWRTFQQTIRPWVVAHGHQWLRPSPVAGLSPLFETGDAAAGRAVPRTLEEANHE